MIGGRLESGWGTLHNFCGVQPRYRDRVLDSKAAQGVRQALLMKAGHSNSA